MGVMERYIEEEGYRKNPYCDTKGNLTGGIGHLMLPTDRIEFNYQWTDEQKKTYWTSLFLKDYKVASDQATRELSKLNAYFPATVHTVITDLKFNMGPNRFNRNKWPKFFRALVDHDYKRAAYELLHNSNGEPSQWSKDVGRRADKIADELRSLA